MTKAKQSIKKICEYCGKEFAAWRASARCCSDYCNKRAYKDAKRKETIATIEAQTANKKAEKIKTELSERQYLSIVEAAKLIGVSRWTVYRYVVSGIIPCTRITKRTTRIKRNDLDLMLSARPYKVLSAKELKPFTEWHTLKEITDNNIILKEITDNNIIRYDDKETNLNTDKKRAGEAKRKVIGKWKQKSIFGYLPEWQTGI